MNVLVVEDDLRVASSIKKTIKSCKVCNVVEIATNFDMAVDKMSSNVFDLLLVDIFLGVNSLSGLDFCEIVRKRDKRIPIIMVTSLHSINYLKKAFGLGVNDYVKKPFDYRELALRVERWVRLSETVEVKDALDYNGLIYDFCKNQFLYRNKKIPLTKRNKLLLKLFLEKPEQLLTTEYIKEKFWGDYLNINKSRNLRSNVQSLRESLGTGCSSWIKTIRGEGYLLKK